MARVFLIAAALNFLCAVTQGKEWRGIVPLKSSRSEVERRFGLPDKWGYYNLKDERVSIEYSDGPCQGYYINLGRDNCKCLVPRDTVMSIFSESRGNRSFSELKLDLTRFSKAAIAPHPHTFEYSDPSEGIDYEVDESENRIISITYYESPHDCQGVIYSLRPQYRNSWNSIIPLHTSRSEVEKRMALPDRRIDTTYVYETGSEIVSIKYSTGKNCANQSERWNVPKDTVLELVVGQRLPFLLNRLNLDLKQYERVEQVSTEVSGVPQFVKYTDETSGIEILTRSIEGAEEVVSVRYFPAEKDSSLRCK